MAANKAGTILATSIVIEYAELLSGKNLQPIIERAYGP